MSYTVSRDNSTADIFDLAEIVGGVEDRVAGYNTESKKVGGGGGNLDTKTCDTLTTADSRKPLGLNSFQRQSLEWDNVNDFGNLINSSVVTSSTFTTPPMDSKSESRLKPGHPNIGRLDDIGNPSLFTTISPKRGHPGLGKLEEASYSSSHLTSGLSSRIGNEVEVQEYQPESHSIRQETTEFSKNPQKLESEGIMGVVPLGSVPGQPLYGQGLPSLGDMSKLSGRNMMGLDANSASRNPFTPGASTSLPFYQMTDDHLYMESASNLTLSSKDKDMENPKCAVTLENVMLGDHKSICSEIGGGGGPWRDILEEMAGNLSGEFGAATSDVFDGAGDRRNNMADGMLERGGTFSENTENMMAGPKSFEIQNQRKKRDFELEAALQNLTSDEVEQRRARMFGEESLTCYGRRQERGGSVTSNGFDSPGNVLHPLLRMINIELNYLMQIIC